MTVAGTTRAVRRRNCEGEGSDEQTLFRGLLDQLEHGDILLGEAFCPTSFLLCELQRRRIDGLFEQDGARKRSTNFSAGEPLGRCDHLDQAETPGVDEPSSLCAGP